jgi:hypothetical protein
VWRTCLPAAEGRSSPPCEGTTKPRARSSWVKDWPPGWWRAGRLPPQGYSLLAKEKKPPSKQETIVTIHSLTRYGPWNRNTIAGIDLNYFVTVTVRFCK